MNILKKKLEIVIRLIKSPDFLQSKIKNKKYFMMNKLTSKIFKILLLHKDLSIYPFYHFIKTKIIHY